MFAAMHRTFQEASCGGTGCRALRLALVGLLAASSTSLVAGEASAQSTIKSRGSHLRPLRIDPTLNVGFFGAYNRVAASGWFVLPILHDGFIPSLNEAFQLEFGASFETSFYDNDFLDEVVYSHVLRPMGGVRYDWYLTEQWQAWVFTKFGANIRIEDDTRIYDVFAVDYGLGAYWHFSPSMALRFEAHSRYPFGIGLSIAL